MCLLVVLYRVVPGVPLIVAANRDELLARPATPMTTLRERDPRIVGGRDERAGGTWLAVNEHGVVAGLTNRPGGASPGRRSRGELPLLAASGNTAAACAEVLRRTVRPDDFGPGWLLFGDRESLYHADITGGETVETSELEPGIHVLENAPLDAVSPKSTMVAERAADLVSKPAELRRQGLTELLASHELPLGAADVTEPHGFTRPRESLAPCVHFGGYGTRWSALIEVADASPPTITYADGPPCTTPFQPPLVV